MRRRRRAEPRIEALRLRWERVQLVFRRFADFGPTVFAGQVFEQLASDHAPCGLGELKADVRRVAHIDEQLHP